MHILAGNILCILQGKLLGAAGALNVTLFRSLLGSYVDIGAQKPWRWHGFAHNQSGFGVTMPSHHTHPPASRAGNPCPAVMGPVALLHGREETERAWAGTGAGFVDAWSPMEASPALVDSMPDGLHPLEDSDEALAVNQLALNALCAMD